MQGLEELLGNISGVLQQLPSQAREDFVFGELMNLHAKADSAWYIMQAARSFCAMATEHGMAPHGKRVLELGGGSQMLTMGLFWLLYGAKSYEGMDKFCTPDGDPTIIERTRRVMGLVHPPGADVDVHAIAKFENGRLVTDESILKVSQQSFEDVGVPAGSVDILYSLAVMEHVDDVRGKVKRMFDALTPGGLAMHTIDLREHFTPERQGFNKDVSLEFLKYSKAEWEAKYPPGTEYFINRLRSSEHRAIFEGEGFEILDWKVTTSLPLDEQVYERIHPEFHKFTPQDLSELGVTVIARKRG